jgi:hypothetical protein
MCGQGLNIMTINRKKTHFSSAKFLDSKHLNGHPITQLRFPVSYNASHINNAAVQETGILREY